MKFTERLKLGCANLRYKYTKWKSEAPARDEARVIKELANIEKAKRIVEMEKQKAELMKQKSKSAKHIAEIRKYSQQNIPKSSEDNTGSIFQPFEFSNASYFDPPKIKKSNERGI